MKKKLRLLVTKECSKNCVRCCNSNFDLDSLPVVDDFSKYSEIIITGGEPLDGITLHKTESLIRYINDWYKIPIIIYTSNSLRLKYFLKNSLDPYRLLIGNDFPIYGITLTFHNQDDVWNSFSLLNFLKREIESFKSINFRLNIFKGIILPKDIDLNLWNVKDNIEWVKNCPLPKDEVFMRMPNI